MMRAQMIVAGFGVLALGACKAAPEKSDKASKDPSAKAMAAPMDADMAPG